MKTDPSCIFCKIIKGELPCHKIYEDDLTLAFLDINPINAGHTLLIPKLHEDHFWNIDDENYHYLMDIAKKIIKLLEKTYSAPRVGLVVEGFDVAHTHLHLIPIYKGLDLQKSPQLAVQEDLKKEAQKIIANLDI